MLVWRFHLARTRNIDPSPTEVDAGERCPPLHALRHRREPIAGVVHRGGGRVGAVVRVAMMVLGRRVGGRGGARRDATHRRRAAAQHAQHEGHHVARHLVLEAIEPRLPVALELLLDSLVILVREVLRHHTVGIALPQRLIDPDERRDEVTQDRLHRAVLVDRTHHAHQRADLVHVDDPIVSVVRVVGERLQYPRAGDGERHERLVLVKPFDVMLALHHLKHLLGREVKEPADGAAVHATLDEDRAHRLFELAPIVLDAVAHVREHVQVLDVHLDDDAGARLGVRHKVHVAVILGRLAEALFLLDLQIDGLRPLAWRVRAAVERAHAHLRLVHRAKVSACERARVRHASLPLRPFPLVADLTQLELVVGQRAAAPRVRQRPLALGGGLRA
eukprot:6686373-Prymnesium_polylepis.2